MCAVMQLGCRNNGVPQADNSSKAYLKASRLRRENANGASEVRCNAALLPVAETRRLGPVAAPDLGRAFRRRARGLATRLSLGQGSFRLWRQNTGRGLFIGFSFVFDGHSGGGLLRGDRYVFRRGAFMND